MSVQEFQKYHDEMKALRAQGNGDELAKRFAAKDSTFMSPMHPPASAADSINASRGKLNNANVVSKIDELTQIGDVIIDRSSIIAQLLNGEKKGWNLSVWVNEDGQWKIRNSCTTFLHDKPQ